MGGPRYPKVSGFQLVEQIGGGGFSKVFRAVNITDHCVAACKFVALTPQTTDKDRKTIEKEMRVHQALKHVNVLEFMNASIVELEHAEKYPPGFYMLLELAAGGDLFDKIAPDVGVGDEVAHYYFGQLLNGMSYIHNQGVCHRDLKPENILLDAGGTLKISDFGLSAVFKLKESGKTRTLTERCGSLPYVAPELNSDKPYHAEPIDAWGVGVILFTLLAGNTPWDEPTHYSPEYRKYLSGEIFREAPWDRFGDVTLSLVCGLLTVDPEKRMTLADVYNHPWCTRPSQLASAGAQTLADKLTEPLRMAGDLEYATPGSIGFGVDQDEDDFMNSAHQSQFTQSLMLFSQTQSGRRYTPQLTRFYASLPPHALMPLIRQTLEEFGVKCKSNDELRGYDDNGSGVLRMRIGGKDRRKMMFKGWVQVENFTYAGREGSFCVMDRDDGNPISWRQLWKALIESQVVGPHVLRK